MIKKAAVVIGVNETGKLRKLKSAAKGAEEVANWLQRENYDVECLTDTSSPVGSRDVEDALLKFVTVPPRYNLLVVYFSGHGYWHARSDRWLLSGAPVRASDAINLGGAMDLARYSGIPNVVFVSDACRSIPDSNTAAKVTGVDAFPNYDQIDKISKIDFFKATSEARSAYEGDIDGKQHSVLTYALMSAYDKPSAKMVRKVKEGATQIEVVSNRDLEGYLQDKVNDILADIDINLTQNIEANVPSGDDVYIARARQVRRAPLRTRRGGARRGGHRSGRLSENARAASVGQTAADAIGRTLARSRQARRGRGATEWREAVDPETEMQLQAHMPSEGVDHFESMVGFSIHGAQVVKAVISKGENNASLEMLEKGDGASASAIIRLWDVQPSVSVAIQLQDGRCAILAGLNGYIGHASFDDFGLANVSYVPSSNHWRWQMYEGKKDKIDRLRALVALAVKDSTFQIRSDKEAESLGRTIRMEKAIDPTLGLYAAHAFSQIGNDRDLRSVRDYMQADLGVDLFDVRVLTSRRGDKNSDAYPFTPCCPMLTQTWNLLRPRGIVLPAVLHDAAPHLCNSLWTTFQAAATMSIMKAFEAGEIL